MAEKEKSVKKEQTEIKTLVVEQLPTQPINRVIDEKGEEFNLITRDEAMVEILENTRRILKGVA